MMILTLIGVAAAPLSALYIHTLQVEAEAAKAEQKKALIRQKVPSEAVRSRLNMTSIDAGVVRT